MTREEFTDFVRRGRAAQRAVDEAAAGMSGDTDDTPALMRPLSESDDRTTRLLKLLIHLVAHPRCDGYVIASTHPGMWSITCLVCGWTSFSPKDVDEKYCGRCGIFHEPTKC